MWISVRILVRSEKTTLVLPNFAVSVHIQLMTLKSSRKLHLIIIIVIIYYLHE